MKLITDKKQKHGVTILNLQGDLDMYTSPEIRDALIPLFRKKEKGIIVDLSEVKYIDSSGIATFVEGLQWSSSGKGKFLLAGLNTNIKDIFKLAKLLEIFDIFDNSEEALNTLIDN